MARQSGYSITFYRATWKVRVRDPYTKRYQTKHFTNKKDGEAWAKERRQRFQARTATTLDITLHDAGEMFMLHCGQLGRSASYIRYVGAVVARAVAFGIRSLSDPVVPGCTQEFLTDLMALRFGQRKAKPASARTRNAYLNILRTVANFAVRRQRLLHNPFMLCDRVRELQHVETVYSLDELKKIVDPKYARNPWWLFGVLLTYTGMRSTEARKATWRWFKWDENLIIIPAEVTKTGTDRMVPLQPELKAILLPRAQVTGMVFEPLIVKANTNETGEAFAAHLNLIGIQATGRIVHRLRHCCASLLTATGVQPFLAMEYIGHRDVRTAQRYSKGAKFFMSSVKNWSPGEFHLQPIETVNVAEANAV